MRGVAELQAPLSSLFPSFLPDAHEARLAEDLNESGFHCLRTFGFQQLDQRSPGDQHEIHVPPERLNIGSIGFSQDPLDAIPVNGTAKAFRHRETDP